MGIDRAERIRHRAYSIWEEKGRPHGEDVTHWQQASEEEDNAGLGDLAVGDNLSVLGEEEPKPAPRSKATRGKRRSK